MSPVREVSKDTNFKDLILDFVVLISKRRLGLRMCNSFRAALYRSLGTGETRMKDECDEALVRFGRSCRYLQIRRNTRLP